METRIKLVQDTCDRLKIQVRLHIKQPSKGRQCAMSGLLQTSISLCISRVQKLQELKITGLNVFCYDTRWSPTRNGCQQ